MAKDNRVRDAAENEESERLLSESPPPVSDGVNLKVYKQQRRAPETLAELAKLNSFDRSPSPSSPAPTNAPMTSNSPSSPPLSQATGTATSNPPRPGHARRQSSFAQPRPDGTPRTPNRVRFEVNDRQVRTDTPPTPTSTTSNGFPRANGSTESNGHIRSPSPDSDSAWLEEEDYIDGSVAGWRGGSRRGQRVPLLTDIEAPSVTVASPGNIDSEEAQDELQELMEGRRAKSGMKSAFMNMANSIIGAGIIGQPYAFRQAGLVTGIVLLVILTIMVDWTIRLIVINSKLSGANSFQATMEHCFGKSGLVAISIAQFAFAFGGMIAFCIIVGDTIPHVMVAIFPRFPDLHFLWLLTDRRAIIILFILGISYPLSLYRDIAKLAKASTLALISMLVILVTVITQGPRVPSDMKGPIKGSLLINNGVFQAIGVISFAFVCHHNSLLIYGSLKKPTLDRFARVTHFSTSISMAACLTMALAGYLNFGDKTKGNVLNNFPSDNVLVNIARLCFGLNMLTTLPLEAFVCREVITTYYFPHEPFHPNRHLIFSTALVFSAMALSLLTCDLGVVFELVGATSACALAYIFPPLCYIKLSRKKKWREGGWERWLASAIVAFGIAVLVISVVLATAKLTRQSGDTQTC